ncbi:Lipase (class 3) [Poseidonocella pacifica]|uniref:Lipase (Class 3) n=1 Tax=Poseidonocella pacifica TaxID=871651 RepID=A0A1I0Y7G6_9RHOB|nr:hypothetical protein [Poseidonocella pacifica]SFB08418.1 Lipase (class 3) [Poseidonocella pacifica]
MQPITLLRAADLMQQFYSSPNRPDVVEGIDINGVQAYYTREGVLIIPGTNEFSDWFEFNFDLFNRSPGESHGFEVVSGDSGARYHAGFLEHARMVYAFAKPLRPKLIVGHSLGAASAQIVGSSLGIPTVAFASPRVVRQRTGIGNEHHVINLCRTDDFVTQVPPGLLGFRHIGKVYWMNPDGLNFYEDHRIAEYIDIMCEARIKPHLPEFWPEIAA